MEFKNVVINRYSCKKFKDVQINKEALEAILLAGKAAPTAKNLQEQIIYVVQSKEKLSIIDGVTPCRYSAPTVLVVAFDKENVYTYPGSTRTSGIEDASIVATHLMLAAYNEGIDSCWVNCFNPEKLKKDLNLPENQEILMLLDLGYADEGGKPLANYYSRKELKDTVKYL